MSRALAVFHGHFGRATVYQLNRPFNMHAHREGHLIFHVGGTPAASSARAPLAAPTRILLSRSIPGRPHDFLPNDLGNGALFFVLYVNAEWFAGVRGLGSGARNSSVPLPWTRISGRRRPWFAALPRSTGSMASCGA